MGRKCEAQDRCRKVRDRNLATHRRAQALFASTVSVHSRPTTAEVEAAISDALLAYGGIGGCAGEMAAAYRRPPRDRGAPDVLGPASGSRRFPS